MRAQFRVRLLSIGSIVLSALLVSVAREASATTITYTGQNFTSISLNGPTLPADSFTTADRIAGVLELAAPLAGNLTNSAIAPVSFSFSNGVSTISDASAPTTALFVVSTNGSGQIVNWVVSLVVFRPLDSPYTAILTQNMVNGTRDTGRDSLCGPGSTATACVFGGNPFYDQIARNDDAPGVWAVVAAPSGDTVPEPASMVLVGGGLAAAVMRRLRNRRALRTRS